MTRPTWTKVTGEARKLGVYVLGALAALAAAGLLPAPWDRWTAVLLAAATGAGVYAVPNASPAAGPPPAAPPDTTTAGEAPTLDGPAAA